MPIDSLYERFVTSLDGFDVFGVPLLPGAVCHGDPHAVAGDSPDFGGVLGAVHGPVLDALPGAKVGHYATAASSGNAKTFRL